MEILQIIDILEDKVEQSKTIPLLNRALIDRDDILASIEELRLHLPDDMKQARFIKDERKRILAEAQTEAEEIIKNATLKTEKMVEEHEITKKAYEQANQIIAAAQKNSRELRMKRPFPLLNTSERPSVVALYNVPLLSFISKYFSIKLMVLLFTIEI